jgi:hypothetical protein
MSLVSVILPTYNERENIGELIYIGRTAGEDNTVITREVGFFMPDIAYWLSQDFIYYLIIIPVTPGSREDNYRKFQLYELVSNSDTTAFTSRPSAFPLS